MRRGGAGRGSEDAAPRDRWASRIGLVLAMAGSAVGLGNFLRFPVQAARNGGGAFMIPYFVSLLLMGIPLMWLEWGMGRYGGRRGCGTTPRMFDAMWRHPLAKYLGVLGVLTPTVIMIYYTYIESWTLGYSVLHLLDRMPRPEGAALDAFAGYNAAYVGTPSPEAPDVLRVSPAAYGFFLATLALNVWILARGVSRGIELVAKVAMPLLFLCAIVLVAWVFTLGRHEATPQDGLGYLWNPDVTALWNPDIWLAAAGQVFFTLSLGMGAVQCYASYMREDADVMLTGLSTTATNEFAEVVLGASIAIPAAVTFFGLAATRQIAQSGAFYLGFVSMPAVFSTSDGGFLLGALWFALLFLAGLTSSVAMASPIVTFAREEFGIRRERAAILLGVFFFVTTNMCIWLRGSLDVMDFWAGTFGPQLLALIEVILMMWIFGGTRMWEEMHRGAELRAPRIFYYAAKYVTPAFLLAILGSWTWKNLLFTDAARGLEGAGGGVGVWLTRLFLLALVAVLCLAVRTSFRRREARP
jgi:NSS family neurotransmitter:Na+ symporter